MWNRPAASFQVMCPGTSDPGLRHGLSLSTSKFSPSRENPSALTPSLAACRRSASGGMYPLSR